jgi:hypothetical protein
MTQILALQQLDTEPQGIYELPCFSIWGSSWIDMVR